MRLACEPVNAGLLGELRLDPFVNLDNCRLEDERLAAAELSQAVELGCRTVIDPTCTGIGRDPLALRRIARDAGINLVMGAGFYLEASHPPELARLSEDAIADRIVREAHEGVDGSDVRIGLIGEIGVSGDFTPAEQKSLRGAARAARRTGLPLMVHLPGWFRHAHRVLDMVETEGADLRHTVLCHMNPSFADVEYQIGLARRGAFLEYDMIGMDYWYADQGVQCPSDEENARAIAGLIEAGIRPAPAAVAGCVPEDDADPLWRLRLRLHPAPLRPAAAPPRCWRRRHPDDAGGQSARRILRRTGMSQVIRVLLAGESWMSAATHYKGFDQFGSVTYHFGAEPLMAALSGSRFELTYMPAHEAAGGFPFDMDRLRAWQVVMLSDIGANTLLLPPQVWLHGQPMPNRLKLLRDFVREGGGLVMVGGYLSFQGIDGRARWRRTPVEEVLPVTCLSYDDRLEVPEGFRAEITAPEHPVLAGLDSEWPALLGANEVVAKPDAQVLARLPEAEGGHPLLAIGNCGRGRSVAWMSDIGPHWAPQAFCDSPVYARLWMNLLAWAAGED